MGESNETRELKVKTRRKKRRMGKIEERGKWSD